MLQQSHKHHFVKLSIKSQKAMEHEQQIIYR